MELFSTNTPSNILPFEGEAIYYGQVLTPSEAQHYLACLLQSIAWKNDEAVIFGKHIITKRKVAWYGNERYSYKYSGFTRQALAWTPELLALKARVEKITESSYNSCLLNLYHNGDEGMAWHSDDEKALAKNSGIASLSLGAERKFSLKHKQSKQTLSLKLEEGSLLLMAGATQTHWLHSLPKTKKVTRPRINLTFRTMLG